jgi:hypothetical protein
MWETRCLTTLWASTVCIFSYRALRRIYNSHNHFVSRLCPSFGIINTRKHNVSKTGSISILRWGGTPILLGRIERANLNHWTTLSKSKSKLSYDRRSVGQSVLVSRTLSGSATNFSFLLEIFFRQLWICFFYAPSLTRGRVCNFLLQLGLASAVPLGSESHGTQDHISLSQFLRLPNLEDQVAVFISPRNRVA